MNLNCPFTPSCKCKIPTNLHLKTQLEPVYLPASDHFLEFTLDQILEQLKNTNCRENQKQTVTAHTTKVERKFDCLKERISISLNRYGEVESILFLPPN